MFAHTHIVPWKSELNKTFLPKGILEKMSEVKRIKIEENSLSVLMFYDPNRCKDTRCTRLSSVPSM